MNVRARYGIAGAGASEIAASIERGIREGSLPPGTQLPPIRTIAAELRVSPATVAAAFQRLRLRGLVAGQGRRGTRVSHRPALPTRLPPAHAPGLRDLADGNPDPKLLPRLPARRAETSRLYGGPTVDARLGELARRQFHADGVEGEIAVVSGGLDGIERVLQAHLSTGDRIAVEDPGFGNVFDLLTAHGFVLEPVSVDDSGIEPRSLARALASRVSALVHTPRAQNPTGAALDGRRARELRAVLADHPELLVVEDDHAGPVSGAAWHSLCPRPRHWAVIRSASKSLGPDLRLAVLAGDAQTIARVEGRQRLGIGWVSHVLQGAVAELWRAPRVRTAIDEARAVYAERRGALIEALATRGITAHGRSGFNVWVPVPEEAPIVSFLAARGWALRAGEPYRIRSAPGVRVTASALSPKDAERLAADFSACLRPAARAAPVR